MWKLHDVNSKLRQDKFSDYFKRTAFWTIRCPVSCWLLTLSPGNQNMMTLCYQVESLVLSNVLKTFMNKVYKTTSNHPFRSCHARCHAWVQSDWQQLAIYTTRTSVYRCRTIWQYNGICLSQSRKHHLFHSKMVASSSCINHVQWQCLQEWHYCYRQPIWGSPELKQDQMNPVSRKKAISEQTCNWSVKNPTSLWVQPSQLGWLSRKLKKQCHQDNDTPLAWRWLMPLKMM
jgi:hypothetical protein